MEGVRAKQGMQSILFARNPQRVKRDDNATYLFLLAFRHRAPVGKHRLGQKLHHNLTLNLGGKGWDGKGEVRGKVGMRG